MTLAELKKNNSDTILDEIPWNDVPAVATGAALFLASLAPSKRPKDLQSVLSASHVLTAGMTQDGGLIVMKLTKKGHPQLAIVYESHVAPDGSMALFRTSPFPADDRRNMKPWNEW